MSLQQTASRIIDRCGRVYTIQRRTVGVGANAWTAGSTSTSFIQCKAREREYFPKEIQGGIMQGDVEITIDPATCSAAPVAGDRIAAGVFAVEAGAAWRQIVAVQAPTEGAAIRLYKVQARK